MTEYDEYEDAEYLRYPTQRQVFLGLLPYAVAGLVAIGTTAWLLMSEASAHQAPSGWDYPRECCSGKDCAEIPASAVKETPDGYRITLPAGSHPMLKTKGYSGVVPYSAARNSPDGAYHICLSYDGAARFCFFAGNRGF